MYVHRCRQVVVVHWDSGYHNNSKTACCSNYQIDSSILVSQDTLLDSRHCTLLIVFIFLDGVAKNGPKSIMVGFCDCRHSTTVPLLLSFLRQLDTLVSYVVLLTATQYYNSFIILIFFKLLLASKKQRHNF